MTWDFNGSLDQFGLGFHVARVRHALTNSWGMKFSLFVVFFELTLVVDMGHG